VDRVSGGEVDQESGVEESEEEEEEEEESA
jgi:hypothetical protein